ncbi:hypothetical protein QJS10_CPA05g02007 [Acorus calamus]|uniref:CBM20 domain-containing protein n=1 Tax=Acorus calamus TaxID=4465 RepID=A0AAV9ES16_ACOCL|nr:hypothetical protein QJS10_CPA05g02007 [Acorus calamus]
MVLCEAPCSPALACGRHGVAFLPRQGLKRVSPLYLYHWMMWKKDTKVTLYLRKHNCFPGSSMMSMKKGNSGASTRPKSCKLQWSIEADVDDGKILYLSGEPLALGCWEPKSAIRMSPSTEHANLWKTEVQVPCGMTFKYSYFIKDEENPSCEIIWRSGPDFSLSVPLLRKRNKKFVVRDLWMRTRINRSLAPVWGSWMDDTILTSQPVQIADHQSPPSGRHERNIKDDFLWWKPFSVDLVSEVDPYSIDTEETEEVRSLGQEFSERYQPVEEPWLLQSLYSLLDSGTVTEEPDPDDSLFKFSEEANQIAKEVVSEDERKLASIEESVSTVILINSSVCTMQRIAILEDDKLVELLLEPVKNNVQCDNVYLGVVTKLLPHMGGAFVDIGIARPSLMAIKRNREPFVYPPFHHLSKGREVNGSVTSISKENLTVHDHVQSLYDEKNIIDEISEVDQQDESALFIPEDVEGQEVEDETEIVDDDKGEEDVGSIDYSVDAADFDYYDEENGNHIKGEDDDDFLPLETENSEHPDLSSLILQDLKDSHDARTDENKWSHVRKGTKVIVQVVKEGLGTKGPALTAYPNLKSRFWVLITQCNRIGVSKKISGVERTRLRVIAKTLQPPGFGLTVRTVAAGHSLEELQKDLEGLLSTWKSIVEHAKSAALAADDGVDGAVPVILHRAMGQTLTVVQDYFNDKVKCMVVDSPRTYHEVTRYLQEIAPELCNRVKLHDKRISIFDEYGIEEEINNILSKRVPLANGGSLVIEQTEALVSIDVNGGHSVLGQGNSQEKVVLDVNLAAAKQIARELRLRDIGGIIVVDFIDMVDESNKRLVYEAIKKAVERDRSIVKVSELSKHGLMEITRKRVRPSVTFMISEPCTFVMVLGELKLWRHHFQKWSTKYAACLPHRTSNQILRIQNLGQDLC